MLSWILELNDLNNSKSPCHPDASRQVLAQSDLRFLEEMWFEEIQNDRHRPPWISEQNDFSNSESP